MAQWNSRELINSMQGLHTQVCSTHWTPFQPKWGGKAKEWTLYLQTKSLAFHNHNLFCPPSYSPVIPWSIFHPYGEQNIWKRTPKFQSLLVPTSKAAVLSGANISSSNLHLFLSSLPSMNQHLDHLLLLKKQATNPILLHRAQMLLVEHASHLACIGCSYKMVQLTEHSFCSVIV